MKRMFFCTVLLIICTVWVCAQPIPTAPYLPACSGLQEGQPPITVQYPYENMTTTHGANHIYLFGKLNLKDSTLDINGQNIPVYKNGTFITFLPVEQGRFQFLLTAQSEGKIYQAVRTVRVPGTPLKDLSDKAAFDPQEIYPSLPVWSLPGEVLALSARGTPKAKVSAELVGLKGGKHIELKEDSRIPGLYRAKYFIRETEKPRNTKVIYTLYDEATKTKTKITAKGHIKILDASSPLQPVRLKDPGVKMRQIPVTQGSLYPFYRAFGEALIDARDKGLYRLRLGNGETAWLEENKLDFFSPSSYRPNHLEEVQTLALDTATSVVWKGRKQVPISIHEFNNRLEMVFYYTPEFEDSFSFDSTSPILDKIEWEDPKDGVLKFILYFKNSLVPWGYSYRYEGNDLILQLYHRPVLAANTQKPLSGARILLDAGHSPKHTPPYDGLVSPSGFLEYEANLALAETLKPKLEAAGATVIMTRQGNNHLSLADRYKKALEQNVHIFVSIHHNALPDTANPLAAPRGYSVYYTYPHSFKLAESIYKSFNKSIPLPDNGLIADDILFIPRISEMPSVLVENAYMILPEQEELVLSEQGREMFAQTLYEGILEFYGIKSSIPHKAKQRKPARR